MYTKGEKMNSFRTLKRAAVAVSLVLVLVVGMLSNWTFAANNIEEPEAAKVEVEVFSQNGEIHHEHVEDTRVDFGEQDEKMLKSSSANLQQIADYNFATKELVNNGDDSSNYCLLICGDGYTASEQNKFLAKAQEIADYFMTRSPFNEANIKNKINIRAVCTVSNASGTSLDPNAPYDTFFRSTFNNNGIERLVCVHDYNRVWDIVRQYMPECVCPIVLCNSEKYGGSGGSVCCLSAHSDSADIAFHEFGHTGAHLADEYWESTTDQGNRSEAPNRTHESNPSKCKWADLIGVNNVGLYAFEEANDWYRPHQSCEMRYLKREFCEVCKRQIRNCVNDNVNSKIAKNTVISNASELRTFLDKMASGASTAGKTVTLSADITANFTVNNCGSWNGTFNGNGHKISNLTVSADGRSKGLFSEVGAYGVVKNLTLDNCRVTSNEWYTGGIAGECKGRIEQCSFSGSVSAANGVGGIAGHIVDGGVIEDCYNLGSVTSTNQVCGGIVGWQDGGLIKNCYNKGNTASTNGWNGGVVGYKPGGTVDHCYFLNGTSTADNGASGKSDSDFSNGSLTNTLNSVHNVWKQGNGYPVFSFTSQNVGGGDQPGNTLPSGYTRAGTEWTELNYWSTFFANGWGGNPTGGYKDGGSYNNFSLYVENAGGGEWAIQLKTKEIGVTQGHKYKCTVGYTASAKIDSAKFKDDKTDTVSNTTSIASGNNQISVEFTAASTAQMFFDLGYAPAGFKFDITSFKLEDITPTTTQAPTTTAPKVFDALGRVEAEEFTANQGGVIDDNGSASGGHNIGGVSNGVMMTYNNVNFTSDARAFKLRYSSPSGVASGRVEIYVDSTSNLVGSIKLPNNGSNWSTYSELTGVLDQKINSGKHTVYTKYVTTNNAYYVANVDWFTFVKASDTKTISDGLEINGYSVNPNVKGMRITYSVDNRINGKDVEQSGVVYSLSDFANNAELRVNSSNNFVMSSPSTGTGKLNTVLSDSNFATSYAMTMKFMADTGKEFSAKWKVCAYAKLSDGSYVYSKTAEYSIFAVADNLYQNKRMSSANGHNFLYDHVLKKVNPSYGRINY